jgi:hypothetical protein
MSMHHVSAGRRRFLQFVGAANFIVRICHLIHLKLSNELGLLISSGGAIECCNNGGIG